jgi:hypothetical protein
LPTLAPSPSPRDPRHRWPLFAAAALGILILSVPIYRATHKPASITNHAPAEQKVDVSKAPQKIEQFLAMERKSSAMIANSGARYGLHFDPDRKSFVKIRNLKFDGSHPITFEAYLRPLLPPDREKQYAGTIMSDARASGMRAVIELDGHAGTWAHSTGLWHGIKCQGSLIGKRTDLATVLRGQHLLFFVNGKQAGSFDLPGSFESSPLPFYIGAASMIDGSPTQIFNGIIEPSPSASPMTSSMISLRRMTGSFSMTASSYLSTAIGCPMTTCWPTVQRSAPDARAFRSSLMHTVAN